MRKKYISLLVVVFLSIVLGSNVASAQTITVKKGDSLWKISQTHHTSVNNLKKTNHLKSDLIFPGQKLNIGTASPAKAASSSKKSAVKTSKNGKKVLTVKATAYTAYCSGCSGITATGINLIKDPNKKVIAVDPAIIPLGSKVYVEGYGTAIAGDTGGAIKGNKIDVFIPSTSKAYQWGVKTVKVTIL